MKKGVILLCMILFFMSGCITRKYIFLTNNTDEIIFFNTGKMGIKSPLLHPDSTVLVDIIFNDHKYKNESYASFLSISLKNDTLTLSGIEYESLIDSLLKNKNNVLKITESWFEKQKNIEK